ncbi:Chaperone activity of bc1 complex-like, mitochondrial, partial [Stegodyphus mimosarum]
MFCYYVTDFESIKIMKSSDLTIILNGLETVTRALIRINETEINKVWRNSTVNTLTKSVATTMEETFSHIIVSSGKRNVFVKVATEVRERGSMVTESVKHYAAYVANRNKIPSATEEISDLHIDHPILNENMNLSNRGTVQGNMQIEKESVKNPEYTENVFPSPQGNINTEKESLRSPESTEVVFTSHQTLTDIQIAKEILPQRKIQKSRIKPQLSERARERKVPSSRFSRLLSYGGLAAGMGIGAIAETARKRLGFKTEKSSSVGSLLSENPFLSEANANRIVDTLCKVRGAALKLGQMLSIQDNAMINPQLAAVFERVRQSADFMPSWQMEKVLLQEFGQDWREKFSEFDPKPFAAASIGQVHCAKLLDGTDVALKIQYPGVAEGIESDISSLKGIITMLDIVPKGMYLENVLAVAERELRREVDYINEAQSGKTFKKLLEPYEEFLVPEVYEDLCTTNVLTTELVYGTPVDKLQDADQVLRNKESASLLLPTVFSCIYCAL